MRVGGVMTTKLVTAQAEEMTHDVLRRMVEANVGAVLICEGPSLVGIFTERDVLRLAEASVAFDRTPIGDVMTSRPVTATADDSIVAVAEMMRDKKVRHVPIVEGEFVHGIVSVRDILAFLMERLWSDHDPAARETAQQLLKR